MAETSATTVVNSLVSSPLPLLIEKLGLAVATAQAALDKNSIALAQEMATTTVSINNEDYNLISLGFAPTFYSFTEATVEAKLEFSVSQSEEFSLGVSVGIQAEIVAVSVSATYARKYEMSAEGSSSIAARLVSLPAPDRLNEILKEIADSQV